MATFADMMSLLMAFFVLLLSFSTMDVIRFKKMADSVKNAFGVQKEIPAMAIPQGVNVIAQHFSTALTEPVPLQELQQAQASLTAEDTADWLKSLQLQASQLRALLVEAQKAQIEAAAKKIRTALQQEIAADLVSVETQGLNIIIRVNETGSFASGSAELKSGFAPVMKKISTSIQDLPGRIKIGGHTDDLPIRNDNYRSNWELSASRAVTVAHYLLLDENIEPARVEVEGHADTQPIVENDTPENRKKNRRVEIILARDLNGLPADSGAVKEVFHQ